MLLIAAFLTIGVSMMHSLLGEKRLITPLLRRQDLPLILGSLENTKATLRGAWHITSFLWWGVAAQLAYLHFVPDADAGPFLWIVCLVFGLSGGLSLVATRGKHLSWVFFLPIALLTGWSAI